MRTHALFLAGLALLAVSCRDDDRSASTSASTSIPTSASSDPATSSAATAVAASTSAPTTAPVATTVLPTAAPVTTGPGEALAAEFGPRLDEALAAEFAGSPELQGYVVLLRADNGFAYTGAAGDAADDSSFRIASVTKMFTAAATLRLVEQDRFGLDDPIDGLVEPETVALLESGGYDPSAITVHQLLTHTAGLFDFTFGPGVDFVGTVFADPQHRWTRREQLELAMQGEPVGVPGAQYHYSDTAYALLGEIVERATGTTLGAAMRDLLRFGSVGVSHTYQESIDPVPDGQPPRLHQWFGDVDTYDWDPSLDLYGGGGLVSTTADLASFIEALLGGRVFDEPATLETMLSVPATNDQVSVPGNPVRLSAAAGIFRHEVEGVECWGHDGFWGVQVLRCPDIGFTMVASRSQAALPPTYTGAQLGAVVLDLVAALGA
jgi:D-alanyl-D-alanine carboxypeptidase